MNEQVPHRLPFWHFFHRIEKDLSYERWIDKYRLFEQALLGHYIEFPEADNWKSFKQFCKILYLQDHRDEQQFDAILEEGIEQEKQIMLDLLQPKKPGKGESQENLPGANPKKDKPVPDPVAPAEETVLESMGGSEQPEAASPLMENSTMYFHPEMEDSSSEESVVRYESYIHSDEYFPVTRRQMAVAWQYLRRKEKRGSTWEMDIPATLKKIAKDGLFLEPVLLTATSNREDTLLMYADCLGCMTPFHEFTRRLIKTAQNEGGHRKAPVYYFQNYPLGYVYRHANLSEPVKVKESLLKANRQATLAIIISDAGAGESDMQPERLDTYCERVQIFLKTLYESVAHVIWLNPMPEHRWKNTPAERIQHMVTVMAPVFDHDGSNFPNTIRLLLKQKRKNIPA